MMAGFGIFRIDNAIAVADYQFSQHVPIQPPLVSAFGVDFLAPWNFFLIRFFFFFFFILEIFLPIETSELLERSEGSKKLTRGNGYVS